MEDLYLFLYKEQPPCKDCKTPIRHEGCHASCQPYLNWKAQREEIIKKKESDSKLNNAFIDMHYERSEKTRKYQRKPK